MIEIFKLVISFVEAIAWPSVVFTSIVYFKDDIRNILRGNIKAKYKEYELTIESLRKAHIEKDTVVETIRKDVEELEIPSIKESIENYSRISSKDENDILSIINKNGGKASKQYIKEQYFEYYDDPWNIRQFGHELDILIEKMIKKGSILINGSDIEVSKNT